MEEDSDLVVPNARLTQVAKLDMLRHLSALLLQFEQTIRLMVTEARGRRSLRRLVRRRHCEKAPIMVVIGAASTKFDGWFSTDLPVLDALNPEHWKCIFPRGSIYRILAEHVIEHWTEEDFRLFLTTARPYLAEDGFVRIAVPDGFHPDPSYIEHVKPGGTGAGADDHKVMYNHVSIGCILSQEEYGFRLLEYFDEGGEFHTLPWDISDGSVARSSALDPRNENSPLSYTSLIVDAWPYGGRARDSAAHKRRRQR